MSSKKSGRRMEKRHDVKPCNVKRPHLRREIARIPQDHEGQFRGRDFDC